MSTIRLSPSALGNFRDCPRCFWLGKVHGMTRPRGIFPSLPGGMDARLKECFDSWRARGGLPPELRGHVPGKLFPDVARLNRWRNWRTGLAADVEGVRLSGALDDLLFEPDGEIHHVVDYKTKGSAPRDGDSEKYYGHQMDCYALLLEANGMRAGPRAFLVYYFPASVIQGGPETSDIRFGVGVKAIDVDPQRARRLTLEAAKCVESAAMPEPSPACEFCPYIESRTRIAESFAKARASAQA